jgi:Na+-translocating ferredoxin:NAD+ oxidoreductase subunit D
MSANANLLELQSSPHLHKTTSVDRIMYQVLYALAPVCIFSVWQFGLSALALLVTCTGACLVSEHFFSRVAQKGFTVSDGSAAITGILLALTLPSGFPLWMAAVGGIISIALGKALFGGIGFNVFNPALVGRAFLQASFPVAITTWSPSFATGRFTEFVPSSLALPFCRPPAIDVWSVSVAVDGFSGATPLALQKFGGINTDVWQLLVGMTAGSAGETCALLLIAAGAYLIVRRVMDWRIPAAVLGAAFLVSGGFFLADSAIYPNPFFMLFSGGLMLGAIFMASDMVGSPVTPLGVWIYGALIGGLTVVIRLKGGLPDGVMYAILLGNAATPLIDQWTQPRIFGQRKASDG